MLTTCIVLAPTSHGPLHLHCTALTMRNARWTHAHYSPLALWSRNNPLHRGILQDQFASPALHMHPLSLGSHWRSHCSGHPHRLLQIQWLLTLTAVCTPSGDRLHHEDSSVTCGTMQTFRSSLAPCACWVTATTQISSHHQHRAGLTLSPAPRRNLVTAGTMQPLQTTSDPCHYASLGSPPAPCRILIRNLVTAGTRA